MKTALLLFTAAMLWAIQTAPAVDLLQRYPTTLTDGEAEPSRAREWSFQNSDVFRLSEFRFTVGKSLKIEMEAADIGIGHAPDGAVWAVLIPRLNGKLASPAAGGEEPIAQVWLRFHPARINTLLPPATVFTDGNSKLAEKIRAIALAKFRSSWHAGMRAMVPPPPEMTVDVDVHAGPRRFFVVNTEQQTAEYVAAFESAPVQPHSGHKSLSLEAAPPVVVKTSPMAGAIQVDPLLAEIQVTYSKLMMDGSWSWSTWSEENYPETTGSPKYLADGRTCVLPVKLQPNKFYAVWLNSAKFGNFKDAHGRSAVPYLLTFATGPATTNKNSVNP